MKKGIKKTILYVLILTLIIAAIPSIAAAESSGYAVSIDGKTHYFKHKPIEENGKIYISFYEFFKAIGKKIRWVESSKTITALMGKYDIAVSAYSDIAYVAKKSVKMYAPAKYIDDRVMVSTEFLQSGTGKKIIVKSYEKPATSKEDKITVTDALGNKVSLKKNPQRVICLYNSYLDLWYLAGGTVVGRIDNNSGVPKGAENVETVGTMNAPNVEKIIALKPDLVILRPAMKGQGQIIDILKSNNIPYLGLEYENINEYLSAMEIFTQLTGRQDLYKKYALDVKAKVDGVIGKVPTSRKPKVLLMFGTAKNVNVRLSNSSVGSMFKDLGAVNIADDSRVADEDSTVFSMEKVIERGPDFIFVQTMGDIEEVKKRIQKDVEENPAWKSLSAVKNSKYIYLPPELYHYKANDRYGEAYEELAKILYPDVFGK